jgi:outer membrane biosynthesis protein TonB
VDMDTGADMGMQMQMEFENEMEMGAEASSMDKPAEKEAAPAEKGAPDEEELKRRKRKKKEHEKKKKEHEKKKKEHEKKKKHKEAKAKAAVRAEPSLACFAYIVLSILPAVPRTKERTHMTDEHAASTVALSSLTLLRLYAVHVHVCVSDRLPRR